jgi:hypothetical protein
LVAASTFGVKALYPRFGEKKKKAKKPIVPKGVSDT